MPDAVEQPLLDAPRLDHMLLNAIKKLERNTTQLPSDGIKVIAS